MAKVETWFLRFIGTLIEVLPRADWPSPDSEFWESYRRAFVRHGVTETVLTEAVQLLAEEPPSFLDRMLPELLAKVKTVWKNSELPDSVEVGSLEAAKLRSRDCIDCYGMGFATRFRHASKVKGKPTSVVFYCMCPMGRALESSHRTGTEKVRDAHARIPDLADHPKLQLGYVRWADEQDNKFRYEVHQWDETADEPKPFVPKIPSIDRMLKSARETDIERAQAHYAATPF